MLTISSFFLAGVGGGWWWIVSPTQNKLCVGRNSDSLVQFCMSTICQRSGSINVEWIPCLPYISQYLYLYDNFKGYLKARTICIHFEDQVYHLLSLLICLPANLSYTLWQMIHCLLCWHFHPRTLMCIVNLILLIKIFMHSREHIHSESKGASTAAN